MADLDGTYAGLQAAIASTLNRADLTTKIPDYILLFEAYARAKIHDPQMENGAGTVAITAGASYGTLPTDFLQMRSASVTISGVDLPLDALTPPVMKARYAYQGAGYPRAVTIIGRRLYVDRPTDIAYTVNLDYWATIPALATVTTNWLLTTYPNVYLYGSCLQAAPKLGADNRILVWKGFTDEAIDDINTQGVLSGYAGPLVAQLGNNIA